MSTKDQPITIYPSELAAALEAWEIEAREKGFAPRCDAERHTDAANWLITRIEELRS